MDKKTIMEMNKKWKNFRLTEAKIFQNGAQHGFDLTDFKPGGFKKFLKALGIPMVAKGSHTGGSDTSNGFYFRNKDIIIITGNNPITGKYRNANRSPEKNYASYVGIETKDPKDMERVVKLFKQNTSYRKGESKGRRSFI
tara:strand:- start:179 stop:598 length:420 start_codon:yes stop_codon:yes gene_type:complete